jgi:hypothetical protein
LEYAIRKVWENQVGLKLSVTHQFLANTDDMNLLEGSKEAGLEVNIEVTKYMLLSLHQNADQSHDITRANRPIDNVAQFKYLEMTVTNYTFIHEEMKKRINSGNVYCHSVHTLLPSCLLSQSVKIKITKVFVLDGCRTWFLTLREEHRSSPSKIRMMKSRRMSWAGHMIQIEEKGNLYIAIVGKPGGKRPLRRLRSL